MTFRFLYIVFFLSILAACSENSVDIEVPELKVMELPLSFPEIIHPEGNEYTFERWSLGKMLFFDPILSKDGKVSCASCHNPELAFTDGEKVSLGSENTLGLRNAPSLANVAYHPYFTREGGVPTLEMQILVPIQEHNEFNNNILLIADTLSKMDVYVEASLLAYNQAPNAFVITRALAQFERSLLSGQSDYDLEYNYEIYGAMTKEAKRGKILFESDRLACATCHAGINFTNYSFENNGLYDEYPDEGRARFTQDVADIAKFKVPSLRNVALTDPYMHDGSMSTLEEVIEHYNSGGASHFNKSELVRQLNLQDTEKVELIAFLSSLSDYRFINNKNFQK